MEPAGAVLVLQPALFPPLFPNREPWQSTALELSRQASRGRGSGRPADGPGGRGGGIPADSGGMGLHCEARRRNVSKVYQNNPWERVKHGSDRGASRGSRCACSCPLVLPHQGLFSCAGLGSLAKASRGRMKV